jgi:hypothetical protein
MPDQMDWMLSFQSDRVLFSDSRETSGIRYVGVRPAESPTDFGTHDLCSRCRVELRRARPAPFAAAK